MVDQERVTLRNAKRLLVDGNNLGGGRDEGRLNNLEATLRRTITAGVAIEVFRDGGARSADDQILGTYLHGLFDTPEASGALLRWAGLHSDHTVDTSALREASLDRIADATQPLLDALVALVAPKAAQ